VAAFRGYQYFSKAICPGTPRRLVAKPRAESDWRSSRVISGLPQTSTREVGDIERGCCRGFEAAVGEQQRDAVGQRGRTRLAGDDRQIGERGFGLGEQFALRHAGDFVAPGQLRRVAHTVRDDQALVVLPDGGILQDGEEGPEPGAAGEHPEVAAGGQLVDGEEAVAGLVDTDRIALAQLPQRFRKGAARHQHRDEFEEVVMGRRGQREGPPDPVTQTRPGGTKPEPRVVPRREAEAAIARGAEAHQRRRPPAYRKHALGGPFLLRAGVAALAENFEAGFFDGAHHAAP
jgi:hypothetical protein